MNYILKNELGSLSNATAILGGAYQYPEEKDSMFFYFNKARQIAIQSNDSITMAFAYLKLVHYYLEENELDSAEYFANKSLRIYRNAKLVDGIQHALGYLIGVNEKLECVPKYLTVI